MTTFDILKQARAAWPALQTATTDKKNAALNAMADQLIAHEADILAANDLDMAAAKGHISDVMLDRLNLTPERIAGMA